MKECHLMHRLVLLALNPFSTFYRVCKATHRGIVAVLQGEKCKPQLIKSAVNLIAGGSGRSSANSANGIIDDDGQCGAQGRPTNLSFLLVNTIDHVQILNNQL